MTPQRIAVKFFADSEPGAALDLEPFIGMFHRFIQHAAVEGLLVDVADYAHVPQGPGVVLIGHDVDYSIDLTGGRTGLLTTRKRHGGIPLPDLLQDTLQKALVAQRAIETDGASDLSIDCNAFTLLFVDRLETPNDDATFEVASKEIEPVLEKLFGGFELVREHADDPRRVLAVRAEARERAPAVALLERLGSTAGG